MAAAVVPSHIDDVPPIRVPPPGQTTEMGSFRRRGYVSSFLSPPRQLSANIAELDFQSASSPRNLTSRHKLMFTNEMIVRRKVDLSWFDDGFLYERLGGHVYQRKGMWQALYLATTALRGHWQGVAFSLASCIVCIYVDGVHKQFVDGSFVKALGMLLAVLLSVRARYATQRRQSCIERAIRLIFNCLDILDLLKTHETRKLMLPSLTYVLSEVGYFVTAQCAKRDESDTPGRMVPREWEARRPALLRAENVPWATSALGPRNLVDSLRDQLDGLFEDERKAHMAFSIDEVSAIRRFHRNADTELRSLRQNIDYLVALEEEASSMDFQYLLGWLILIYVSLYPWCVTHESSLVMVGTGMLMTFIFYSLNTLTHEHENPFGDHGSDLNLPRSFHWLCQNLERHMTQVAPNGQ